jgi:CBS-domain-containing membrane protein
MAGEVYAGWTASTTAPARGATAREPHVPDAEVLLRADRAKPLPIVSREGRLIGVLTLNELLVRIDRHRDQLALALSRELRRCRMTAPD